MRRTRRVHGREGRARQFGLQEAQRAPVEVADVARAAEQVGFAPVGEQQRVPVEAMEGGEQLLRLPGMGAVHLAVGDQQGGADRPGAEYRAVAQIAVGRGPGRRPHVPLEGLDPSGRPGRGRALFGPGAPGGPELAVGADQIGGGRGGDRRPEAVRLADDGRHGVAAEAVPPERQPPGIEPRPQLRRPRRRLDDGQHTVRQALGRAAPAARRRQARSQDGVALAEQDGARRHDPLGGQIGGGGVDGARVGDHDQRGRTGAGRRGGQEQPAGEGPAAGTGVGHRARHRAIEVGQGAVDRDEGARGAGAEAEPERLRPAFARADHHHPVSGGDELIARVERREDLERSVPGEPHRLPPAPVGQDPGGAVSRSGRVPGAGGEVVVAASQRGEPRERLRAARAVETPGAAGRERHQGAGALRRALDGGRRKPGGEGDGPGAAQAIPVGSRPTGGPGQHHRSLVQPGRRQPLRAAGDHRPQALAQRLDPPRRRGDREQPPRRPGPVRAPVDQEPLAAGRPAQQGRQHVGLRHGRAERARGALQHPQAQPPDGHAIVPLHGPSLQQRNVLRGLEQGDVAAARRDLEVGEVPPGEDPGGPGVGGDPQQGLGRPPFVRAQEPAAADRRDRRGPASLGGPSRGRRLLRPRRPHAVGQAAVGEGDHRQLPGRQPLHGTGDPRQLRDDAGPGDGAGGRGGDPELPPLGSEAVDDDPRPVGRHRPGEIADPGLMGEQRTGRLTASQVRHKDLRLEEQVEPAVVETRAVRERPPTLDHQPPVVARHPDGSKGLPPQQILHLEGTWGGGRGREQEGERRHEGDRRASAPPPAAAGAGHHQLRVSCSRTKRPTTSAFAGSYP